jgi:hypothetical protein
MSTVGNYRRPNIVNDGLTLYLDAGTSNSYNRYFSANTWKDISGNGRTGTFVNGPTYDSGNGGSIVFDGLDDYIALSPLVAVTSFTVEIWFNSAGAGLTGNTGYNTLIGGNNANRLLYNVVSKTFLAQMGGGNHFSTGTTQLNTWCCVHYTYNSSNTTAQWFINTIADTTFVGAIGLNTSQTLGVGTLASGYYFNGKMSRVLIYNKALSSTEILQNYNASRARFGL